MVSLEKQLVANKRDLMLNIVLSGDHVKVCQALKQRARQLGVESNPSNELRDRFEQDCNTRFVELIRAGKTVLGAVDILISEQRIERWNQLFSKEH